MDSEFKKRSKKTSHEQYEYIVTFMEQHKLMMKQKTSPSESAKVEQLWKQLANELNNKKGPQRNPMQWKRVFIEYKSKVKARARAVKCDLKCTGGGPAENKPLTDLEERVMKIVGWVCTSGDPENVEYGLQSPVNDNVSLVLEMDEPHAPDNNMSFPSSGLQGFLTPTIPEQDFTTEEEILLVLDQPTTESLQTKENIPKTARKDSKTKVTKVHEYGNILRESNAVVSTALQNIADSLNNVAESNRNLAQSNNNIAEVFSGLTNAINNFNTI